MTTLGLIFPPDQPPERLFEVAHAVEQAGLDELWLWEDCFAESGIATAAAVLASTQRLRVGIGLLPVPLRNPALTAMELATLARLFPGRLLPGLGHGVLEWMGQVGARADSPLTLLREYATAVRALLDGDQVTCRGRYVTLDRVQLRWPPSARVPLFVGGIGPKTLALAGEVADGVIFTGGTSVEDLRRGIDLTAQARAAAGVGGPPEVVSFLSAPVDSPAGPLAESLRAQMAAGVTRAAVCAIEADGPPVAGERLLDIVPVLRQVRRALR